MSYGCSSSLVNNDTTRVLLVYYTVTLKHLKRLATYHQYFTRVKRTLFLFLFFRRLPFRKNVQNERKLPVRNVTKLFAFQLDHTGCNITKIFMLCRLTLVRRAFFTTVTHNSGCGGTWQPFILTRSQPRLVCLSTTPL